MQSIAQAEQLNFLWVPGGDPARLASLMENREFMGFLRRQSEVAEYTASVCEGALLLAAAGLLDGYRATTHWAFYTCLQKFPKIEVVPCYPCYVVDRNRITGGGISSGMDEALKVIALLGGDELARTVQLTVQYNPMPPFRDGDPSVADPPILSLPACDKQLCQAIERVLHGQTTTSVG